MLMVARIAAVQHIVHLQVPMKQSRECLKRFAVMRHVGASKGGADPTMAQHTNLYKCIPPTSAPSNQYAAQPKEREPIPDLTPKQEKQTVFHYLWMFIVGIIVGAIARLIMPGSEHMGLIMTGVIGIVGSFIGGFIARLFSKPADGAIVHPAGLIMSVIGALILLFIVGRIGV
jgi:uncharacterized membrane protein YeaQ/YmgE (transglycosylase-associated protein family)